MIHQSRYRHLDLRRGAFLLADRNGAGQPPLNGRRDLLARIRAKHCRVFVAEDHDPFRHQLTMRLKVDYKAEVEFARSGENTIDMVKNAGEPFDLILMDVRLLGLNGVTVYDAIRAAGVQTEVIFMSGYCDEDVRRQIAKRNAKILHKEELDYSQIEAVLLRCRGGDA